MEMRKRTWAAKLLTTTHPYATHKLPAQATHPLNAMTKPRSARAKAQQRRQKQRLNKRRNPTQRQYDTAKRMERTNEQDRQTLHNDRPLLDRRQAQIEIRGKGFDVVRQYVCRICWNRRDGRGGCICLHGTDSMSVSSTSGEGILTPLASGEGQTNDEQPTRASYRSSPSPRGSDHAFDSRRPSLLNAASASSLYASSDNNELPYGTVYDLLADACTQPRYAHLAQMVALLSVEECLDIKRYAEHVAWYRASLAGDREYEAGDQASSARSAEEGGRVAGAEEVLANREVEAPAAAFTDEQQEGYTARYWNTESQPVSER